MFLQKNIDVLRNILQLGLCGLDVAIRLSENGGGGSGPLGNLDLGEAAIGEGGLDGVLVRLLGEYGDDVAFLLVERGEDLAVDALESIGGVLGNGADDREYAPVSGVQVDVDRQFRKQLEILLRSV